MNVKDLADAITYPGLIKMGFKYLAAGVHEISSSLYTPLQVKELQKFVPDLKLEDVQPGPAGVRAQAVDPSGTYFLIL